MKDIALAAGVLAAFAFGYFLMVRLDRYLSESRRYARDDSEEKQPSRVLLTEQSSEDEIGEAIARFKETHGEMRILIYDPAEGGSGEEQ